MPVETVTTYTDTPAPKSVFSADKSNGVKSDSKIKDLGKPLVVETVSSK